MANLTDISNNDIKQKFLKRLSRIIQSANLNFFIGSGCSSPAIAISGNIENEIKEAREGGENNVAEHLLHGFLVSFLENTKMLLEDSTSTIKEVLDNYQEFIGNIGTLLFNRKSNILPSQAIVFSTNYDLFIEYAMKHFNDSIILCDGFKRTSDINNNYYFSSSEYFNSIYNTGNLYRYKVEIPTINLIKIHGSLNWQKKNGKIIQDLSYLEKADKIKDSKKIDEIKEFNLLFNIVLPQEDKFSITILEQIYYDLLRIYSNELDKENTVLIVEGFSFSDQHILEITTRALRNKTFNLLIFCYDENDTEKANKIFYPYRNVDIISNGNDKIDFKHFNKILSEIKIVEEDDA
jgi:hypothetical protein